MQIQTKFSKNKQLVDLAVYVFGQLFNLVTPLLVVPYIVFVCGEANFGKSAIGMAIVFFLIVFVDYGSDIIGVKEVSIHRHSSSELERIFWTTYGTKTIVLCVTLFVTVLLFNFVPFFEKEKLLFLLSLTVLIGQFLNPTWFLQGTENVKWITYLNVLSKSIYLIGIFYFVVGVKDYVYINLWWGIGMTISNMIFVTLLIIKHEFNIRNVDFHKSKQQLSRDFKMFTSQIFVSLQMYAPVVLLGYFGNATMAGQYKIIDQVVVIFKTYILLSFNYIYPKICFDFKKNEQKGFRNWILYNGVNFGFISISMLFIYLLSDPIIQYFNPNDQGELIDLLKIAIFTPVLLVVSTSLKQLILAWDFDKFYIKFTMLSVIISITAVVLLIPIFGYYSVFYALIGSEILIILFYISCVRKRIMSITSFLSI